MTARARFSGLSVIAVMLVASEGSTADPTIQSMASVREIYVTVADMPKELADAGLTSDLLQTDVELRLRSVGIRIVSSAEAIDAPSLQVSVNGLETQTARGAHLGYAAAVSFEFFQDVSLVRKPKLTLKAATWSVSNVAVGPTTAVIRDCAKDLADKFANDFLTANPKK